MVDLLTIPFLYSTKSIYYYSALISAMSSDTQFLWRKKKQSQLLRNILRSFSPSRAVNDILYSMVWLFTWLLSLQNSFLIWIHYLFHVCQGSVFKSLFILSWAFPLVNMPLDLTLGRRSGPPLGTRKGAPSWPLITWQKLRLCVTA